MKPLFFLFSARTGGRFPAALFAFAAFAALLGVTALAAGCGGSLKRQSLSSQSAPSAPASASGSDLTGRATFSVAWPVRSGKLVPLGANSIRVRIYRADGSEAASPGLLGRDRSSLSFNGLPVGNYAVSATAYPNADGSGTAQAQGMAQLPIQADATTAIDLEMNTTIAQVAVRGDSGPLSGDTVHYYAEARDGDGKVVLTDPEHMTWRVSDSGKLKVSTSYGMQADAYCSVPSSVSLYAKDTETGVESAAYNVIIKERSGGIFRKGGLPGEDRHDVSGKVASDGNFVYLLQAINESGRAPIDYAPKAPCDPGPWDTCKTGESYQLPSTINRYQILRYSINRSTDQPEMTADAMADVASIVQTTYTDITIGDSFNYSCGQNDVFHGLAADTEGSLYFGVKSAGSNRLVKGKVIKTDGAGSPDNGQTPHYNASFVEDAVFAPDAAVVKNVRSVRVVSDNLYVLTDTGLFVLNKTTGEQISFQPLPTGLEYRSLAVSASGDIFLLFKDAATSKLVKLAPTGALVLLRNDFGDARDMAALPGDVLVVAADAAVTFLSRDGTTITPNLTFDKPSTPQKPLSLAEDSAGWLYVLDDTSLSDVYSVQTAADVKTALKNDAYLSASYSVYKMNR